MDKLSSLLSEITSYTEWLMLFFVIGGGLYLIISCKFLPYFYFCHTVNILRGKFDKQEDKGEVSHFQALSAVVANTVGMGNISGVAIAIHQGGPGIVFWMWMTALIGACIKFYSCSLAIIYREEQPNGSHQGGTMYYMTNGIKKYGKPMAIFFCIVGMVGVLPAFTVNQLTQTILVVVRPENYIQIDIFYWKMIIGTILLIITSFVIFGGIKSIVKVSSALVPFMVVIYILAAIYIFATNASAVFPAFELIFQEAFNFKTAFQGGFWALIILGVRRAIFSNESGLGTAPMYHGQSKTNKPIEEGLVAMFGPYIDTIIVCTITALIIIISGSYETTENNGIALTLHAFDKLLHGFGDELLMILVIVFAVSSLFTYSYYGTKCLSFIAGEKIGKWYNYFYIASILLSAMASLGVVLGLIDLAFALMCVPNMIAVLWLSPKVNTEMKKYFMDLKNS